MPSFLNLAVLYIAMRGNSKSKIKVNGIFSRGNTFETGRLMRGA